MDKFVELTSGKCVNLRYVQSFTKNTLWFSNGQYSSLKDSDYNILKQAAL